MRIQTIFLILIVLMAFGCSSKEKGIEQAEAIAIAIETAGANGEDVSKYQEPQASFNEERGEWMVSFKMLPPTPPGGHFAVIINNASGEAQFMHGE